MRNIFKVMLLLLISLIMLHAQQQYITSVNDPAMGTISPAGVSSVNVGDTAMFYVNANEGYEYSIFKKDGVDKWTSLRYYEEIVQSVGDPINFSVEFKSVTDKVPPYCKIVNPISSTVIQSGQNNQIDITFDDDDAINCSLFVDEVLVSTNAVMNGDGTKSFNNIALQEGDNLFAIKISDIAGNSSFDYLLAHYTAGQPNLNRAAIVIDSRLMAENGVSEKINLYKNYASEKMGSDFDIIIENVSGIDDWNSDQVKNYVINLKNTNPFLEGVFFIGNVKLPSYYKPRGDYTQSRLITHKYEDFDIVLNNVNNSQADYDNMAKGVKSTPDIWNAYLPVGFSNQSNNNYGKYAEQVNRYFDKVLSHYETSINYSNFYQVSNDIWDLSGLYKEWGPRRIDYYGINNTGYGPFQFHKDEISPELFYKRAAIEDFADYDSYNKYARRWTWMGEDWQSAEIFTNHMEKNLYNIVQVNVHSGPRGTLISNNDARVLSSGGLIFMGSGCSIAGIAQPGNTSYINENPAYADENILMSYLLGESNFLATLGCTFNRAHESYFEKMSAMMAQGDYLGISHFFRKCLQYQKSNAGSFPLNTQEIVLGDPFLKIENSKITVPNNVSFGTVHSEKLHTKNIVLTNNSEEQISITNVTVTNNAFNVLETNFTLLPWEKREISINFESSTLGENSGVVNFTTNDLTIPNIAVKVKADCVDGNIVYLSDINWVSATTGWGSVQRDYSADGSPILLKGVEYTKGLGASAYSEIVYNLNGEYKQFISIIGLDDHYYMGSIIFEVWGDGVKLYESQLMQRDMQDSIDISVLGVNELKLIINDGDGNDYSDFGDWVEARIIKANTLTYHTITTAIEPKITAGSCNIQTWNETEVYTSGNEVSYSNSSWRAKWWSQGDVPGNSDVWEYVSECISEDTVYGGIIVDSGNVSVEAGTSKTFTIEPKAGYQIDDVLVDGISVGAVTSYTFSNVNEDHTIFASFKDEAAVVGDLVVLRNVSPEHGEVSGSGSYTIGNPIQINATAKTGYRFVRWDVKTTNVAVADENSANTLVTLTNNSETAAIEAIFEIVTGCTTPAWDPSVAYTNEIVSHNGFHWQSKWWNKGAEPGNSGQWGPWDNVGVCE